MLKFPLNNIFHLQRRSLAPSQILKRKQGFLDDEEIGNKRKQVRRNGIVCFGFHESKPSNH